MFRNIRLVNRINYRPFSSEPSSESLYDKFKNLNRENYFTNVLSKNSDIAKLKRASVLVPISISERLGSDGKMEKYTSFTLSKRAEKLKSFKGDVCFIGGRIDKTDKNEIETAFREAREEANMEPGSLKVLAQLCPFITFTQILVTPVICYFDKTNFKPIINKDEVDFLFDLPTERFLSNRDYDIKKVGNERGSYNIHYFKDNLENREIVTWGFTSFLSISISIVLHSRMPDFEFELQPNLNGDNLNEVFEQYLLKNSQFQNIIIIIN